MPYIQKEDRDYLFESYEILLKTFKGYKIRGNVNYLLFKLAKHTCKSYSDYADFISELNECSAEIRRRLLAPHEDKKIEENGDVE